MANHSVSIIENVAATAYTMAKDLWFEKHQKNPSMDDEDFLKLVNSCAKSLKGNGTPLEWYVSGG